MQEQVLTLEQAAQFRNGQNLLLANRPEEALVSFEKVAEVNPNYPQLDAFMGQARKMLELESTYQEALQLKTDGNYSGSLEKFQWVYDRDARYKDVALQIKDLQKSLNLEDLFAQSAAAFGDEPVERGCGGF